MRTPSRLSGAARWLRPQAALLAALLLVPAAARAQAAPQVRFQPAQLTLEAGQQATLTFQVDPPGALGQVWISGPPRTQLEWRRQGDQVQVKARQAGTWTLVAQRGPGGATLATARVEVESGVLARVLERVRQSAQAGRRPLVVFDLDDTLFDTRWRTLINLRAWGHSHGEQRLIDLQLEDVRYELTGTLRNAGLSSGEIAGTLGRAIASFQSQHWFDYQLDRPFPGALEWVRAVVAAGGQIVYVTGRSEVRRAASEAVLAEAGFPVESAWRYFRPTSYAGSSASYKGNVTRNYLPLRGEVVATFDNEPANCNAFLWAAPQAIDVHIDTLYPLDSPALASGVEILPGWD